MVQTWQQLKTAGAKTPALANGARSGLNKGHITTKLVRPIRTNQRQALAKTKLAAVKEVVLETSGFTPYEKRCVELLKVQREKRCLRFAKRRLGTFLRGKKKREIMSAKVRQMAAAAMKKSK